MGVRATIKIRDIDMGYRAIVRTLSEEVRGSYVKAGVLGGAKDRRPGEKIGNVELAVIHEFGAPGAGIPERSFIRRSFTANLPRYQAMLVKLVHGIYEGKVRPAQALGLVGQAMKADIVRTVTQGPEIPPPNSPRWFAEKLSRGHWRKGLGKAGGVPVSGPIPPPRTLVDTGRMIGSVTYEVVPGKKSFFKQLARALGSTAVDRADIATGGGK